MATKKKNHWYVLVLTDKGPTFVTGEGGYKTAYWNKLDVPAEFSESYAKDMALGLMLNGYAAFAVCNGFELDKQPYRYEMGEFEWVDKKGESENEG